MIIVSTCDSKSTRKLKWIQYSIDNLLRIFANLKNIKNFQILLNFTTQTYEFSNTEFDNATISFPFYKQNNHIYMILPNKKLMATFNLFVFIDTRRTLYNVQMIIFISFCIE